MEHDGQIRHLGLNASTAIRMDGGYCVEVSAVGAKATKIKAVQKPGPHSQLPQYPISLHPVQHVLLFLPFGAVPFPVPRFEKFEGPIVGFDHVEAGVDAVGFRPLVPVEPIYAYLKIYVAAALVAVV